MPCQTTYTKHKQSQRFTKLCINIAKYTLLLHVIWKTFAVEATAAEAVVIGEGWCQQQQCSKCWMILGKAHYIEMRACRGPTTVKHTHGMRRTPRWRTSAMTWRIPRRCAIMRAVTQLSPVTMWHATPRAWTHVQDLCCCLLIPRPVSTKILYPHAPKAI
jgi:hypothetical protein